MMNNVYIAGRYSRKEEFNRYAAELEGMGYEIVSSWMKRNETEGTTFDQAAAAEEDLDDLLDAGVVIVFTQERGDIQSGGHLVEFGIALGVNIGESSSSEVKWTPKRILVIGPKSNIFCYLSELGNVEAFSTWEAAKRSLAQGNV